MRLILAGLIWMAFAIAPASAAEPAPAPEQARAARQAVDAYHAAIDADDVDAAFIAQGSGAAGMSRDDLAVLMTTFRETAGPVVSRRITRVTYYSDPQDQPPGLYAAFDLVARFANIDRYCGYAVAFQAKGGAGFVVIRTEQNFIDNASAAGFTAPDGPSIETFWPEFARSVCPGWEPEAST